MLSGPHQKFAEGIANGLDQTAAYQAAYPKTSAANARKNAPRLTANDDIKAEVERIRRAAEVLPGGAVLTLAEKRKFLRDVVMTPISQISPDSPLCQSYKHSRRMVGRGEEAEEWETDEYKVPDKLKAIEVDAKLAGELSDKVQVSADDELKATLAAMLNELRK